MENSTRSAWLSLMLRITDPVLSALEREELKSSMPLSFHKDRAAFAPLEAFGRSLDGLSGWFSADPGSLDEEERILQQMYIQKAVRCIRAAANPASGDFMTFDEGTQPLVDTAFLAHALVRAPVLVQELSEKDRHLLADAFRMTRKIPAYNSNWILFSAMVEAGLYVLGEHWDIMRVLYALRTFQLWYKGDGIYGDGAQFHWDYYNSFVIQPMCVDLAVLFSGVNDEIRSMQPEFLRHAKRYAAVLERMIGPDGSYPVIGRSVCYRFGAFQLLSQMALLHQLPEALSPASVRCALDCVIRKISESGIFDERGWLVPGVMGYQPELAEGYINVGSLYLCTTVFLPLGLAPCDPFWKDPDEDWTARKVSGSRKVEIDHAED